MKRRGGGVCGAMASKYIAESIPRGGSPVGFSEPFIFLYLARRLRD
jgi:hypothetical protein